MANTLHQKTLSLIYIYKQIYVHALRQALQRVTVSNYHSVSWSTDLQFGD